MKIISKMMVFLICLLFIPFLIFGQNLPVNSEKSDTSILENASIADSDSFKVYNNNYILLRNYLNESGSYLKKSSKAYSTKPTRSLNIISETENIFLGLGAAFFLLPIELTISRTYGEFASAYYFGKAGDELLKASDYIKGDNMLSFKNAGHNFKKCEKYNYLSGGLMAGGIAISTYSWFNLLDNKDKPNYFPLGLSSILAGRLLRLIPLSYAKSAGGDIISISNLFKTEEQNELFYKAGKNIKNYTNYTYWGYGLQGLGTVLFLASGDNTTMAGWGLGTAILSWFIFDEIGLKSLKKAGDKLIDLSRLLL